MKYIYFQRIRLLKNKIAAELRDIQKKAAEAKKKKIKKILTPEQYAKWQTEQATARQKAPQMRMHKGNHTNKI